MEKNVKLKGFRLNFNGDDSTMTPTIDEAIDKMRNSIHETFDLETHRHLPRLNGNQQKPSSNENI